MCYVVLAFLNVKYVLKNDQNKDGLIKKPVIFCQKNTTLYIRKRTFLLKVPPLFVLRENHKWDVNTTRKRGRLNLFKVLSKQVMNGDECDACVPQLVSEDAAVQAVPTVVS